MINDLDEALRQLLINEIPIKNGEVDVSFDQPKREWSARLNRPTLNLFLYDVSENKKLRQTRPMWEIERHENGNITQKRKPVRINLQYIVTAWATEADDEHRLLSRAMMALFRFPNIPEEVLPEVLLGQSVPIPITIAQKEELLNPSDLWSALDNELRPAFACTITLEFNPYLPITGPAVRTRELRFGQAGNPELERLNEGSDPDVFWTIGGMIESDQPIEDLRMTLVERELAVQIQPEGRFAIGNLQAGDYTLEVSTEGGTPTRHQITVPSPDYNLNV